MSSQNHNSERRTVLKRIAGGVGAVGFLANPGRAASQSLGKEPRTVPLTLRLDKKLGPLDIGRFGVGYGGCWDKPIWLDRAGGEIRALRSKMIRLFVQEYFDLLPSPDRYNWSKLDQSVDMILEAGSAPLMCLTFKPRLLFPTLDQNVVIPNDWQAWERLVYELIRHYKERAAGIRYWEIGNEGDIGALGGCPYKFTPESYELYYQHTVSAIRRADPEARVGGPALAFHRSPILPALLSFCARTQVPLNFVSWHNYSNKPQSFRESIDFVKTLLRQYPSLHIETILDEWNESADGGYSPDPRFQPCFIAEVTQQMLEGGLEYGNYYHVRDSYVDPKVMAFVPGWNVDEWNRQSHKLGLFDFQNIPRPAYFVFRLLSRLTGERIEVECPDQFVHALASYDDSLRVYNLLLWNFSGSDAQVNLRLTGGPSTLVVKRLTLDSVTPNNEEFARLRRDSLLHLDQTTLQAAVDLEPYGVKFWELRKRE